MERYTFKMSSEKNNINTQSSEDVSYDTFIKTKTLLKDREEFYIRQLCEMIDATIERKGQSEISILEIGFNRGERLSKIRDIYPDAKIVGLEVREQPVLDMVEQGYDCRLVETELFDEVFPAQERFDVVYGFAVLHHMSDSYKTLESVIRLLNPGGALMFIREDHPFDLLSHFHTTISRNWRYEKGKWRMNRKHLQEVLGRYTQDYYVKYENNGLAPCFKRLNKIYCKLKMHRIPLCNSINIYAQMDSASAT